MERRPNIFSKMVKLIWRWAASRVVSPKDYDKDEYGCVTVTKANFDDVVMKNNKDVLIVFYNVSEIPISSAYGQREKKPDPLEKILKALVRDYANELDTNTTLARCNVAEHEVPVEVYRYPTIKMYPGAKKRFPVEYFGKEDNIDQYKAFITSEGSRSSKSELHQHHSRHGKQTGPLNRQGSNPEAKRANVDEKIIEAD